MPQKEEKRKEGTKETGKMTKEEAGRKGAESRGRETSKVGTSSRSEAGRKGGEATKETHGREFYQEIGRKGGQASGQERSSKMEETSEMGRSSERGGEVVVKRSGKDIDVTFSNEQDAQDWENSIRPMLEESGYHFTREKPAAAAAEAAG
ncbi:MAG: glucose starvation-inducible protein B [Candidatus Methanoperedens sp.]|nr:glucose starvation-inducible protein B [Candidatus Methanoperedens sp.]